MPEPRSVSPDLTRLLAEGIATASWDSLPPAMRQVTSAMALDTLACMAAGAQSPVARPLRAAASLVDSGPRLPTPGVAVELGPAATAFLSGGLAHAFNYDCLGPAYAHVGLSAVPVPYAASGLDPEMPIRRFLTALAVGSEVAVRLAAVAQRVDGEMRWLDGQVIAYFAATAAAANALGLDATQTHSALGLALMQTAGSAQVMVGGDVPAKATYGAYPALAGLLSAQLAAQGLDAAAAAVEGECGLLVNYLRADPAAAGEVADGFADVWRSEDVTFKPWPCSGLITPYVEAALLLRGSLGGVPVSAVTITAPESLTPWIEPWTQRCRPANVAAAGNSLPFLVGFALREGSLTVTGLQAAVRRNDGDADGFTLTLDSSRTGSVAVELADGTRAVQEVLPELGSARRPLSPALFREKLSGCFEGARGELLDVLDRRLSADVDGQMSDVHDAVRTLNRSMAFSYIESWES
jgi:2-methylcitrate dehydratase PrpD